MKVWVTGYQGMLGSAVFRACQQRGHEPVVAAGKYVDISEPYQVEQFILAHKPKAIINCAGRLKGANPLDMIQSNALGPHVLQAACIKRGLRLIHISTDCVFSGLSTDGKAYTIYDRPDPRDIYGRTKLVGESIIAPNVLVVRTSFVGLTGGLLRWLRSQQGEEVQGWTKAIWNGTSVHTLADWLAGEAGGSLVGLAHVASAERVSKFWLLETLNEILSLGVKVTPDSEVALDRSLAPTVTLPPLREALERLAHG